MAFCGYGYYKLWPDEVLAHQALANLALSSFQFQGFSNSR
jgi:hypothetical protein